MTLLTSKWLIGFVAILGVMTLLYLFGRKSVHSEIVIPAAPNQVWTILIDTKSYGQWNKVLIPLEGSLQEGSTVKYAFYQEADTSYEILSNVKKIIENQLLNQGGGMPGILTFDHRYVLESVDEGTKVIIHEDYRGIGVPFWNPAPVEASYNRLNQALKNRVIEVYAQ